MTFSEGGNFEGGRVRKGSGRGRTGAIAGGGIGAVLVALLAMFFGGGGDLGNLTNALSGGAGTGQQQPAGEEQFIGDCTAAEANVNPECELSATIQSLDAYWSQVLPQQAGVQYVQPPVESFTGATSTACGSATSDTGPFYCPPDQTIYIDLAFYDELVRQFGSSGGPLARKYVVAHEMGHHIENLIGAMDAAQRGGSGAESDSVRIELMADCLAGMWAAHASSTVDPDTGVVFMNPLTQQDLNDAVSAAQAVGDDRIQAAATGRVNPDLFTHGSAQQRVEWFARGYNNGTLATCDALSAQQL